MALVGFGLNVQDDECFPSFVAFLKAEAMKCYRFNIGAKEMAPKVHGLTASGSIER